MPRMFDMLRRDTLESAREEEVSGDAESLKKDEKKRKRRDKEDAPCAGAIKSQGEICAFEECGPSDDGVKGVSSPDKAVDGSLVSEKLISVVRKYGVDNHENAREIYEHSVATINGLIGKVRLGKDIAPYMDTLHRMLDVISNQLILGDSLLDHIYSGREDSYYLPYHIVNVLILSATLALNMGFNKSALSHLGLSCIFYDLGIDTFREMVCQPRKLNAAEYNQVRKHIDISIGIIEKLMGAESAIKETISMHHERVSGRGYPLRAKEDRINQNAKILGLVDTYISLSNPRSFRNAMTSHEAIKTIIDSHKDDFDERVMKVFINKMSVYPVGSMVRLNTGEIARVIAARPGSPLRPVIIMLRDPSGKPVNERGPIDLSKQDSPLIKDSVN